MSQPSSYKTVLPRLIGITDRSLCSGDDYFRKIEEVCRSGLPALQFREKDLPFEEFCSVAADVAAVAKCVSTKLFINIGADAESIKRAEFALKIGATGVHVPDGGIHLADLRRIVGSVWIGQSIHEETLGRIQSNDNHADFFILAPVWKSPDKFFSRPIDLERFKAVCLTTSSPIFALGGITPERAESVLRVGAYGFAIRSALWKSSDAAEVLLQFRQILQTERKEESI